jgi:WXG100 family type VII secretion target
MAMNPIEVTPQMISTAALDCKNTAGEVDGDLVRLKAYVTEMQGMWHGIAADQWSNLMIDFDTYARMLHDALTNIGLGLDGNAVNYVESEMANINSLVAVNGDIPGARL